MDYKKELERIVDEAVEECISEGVFKNIPIEECRKSLNQTADKISDIFKNRHFNEVDEHYFLNNLKLHKKLIKSVLSGDRNQTDILYKQLVSDRNK